MILTDDELYALFLRAGFSADAPVPIGWPDLTNMKGAGYTEDRAAMMVAIALRESEGDPSVLNDTAKTGDYSCGLCQINLLNRDIVLALAHKLPTALVHGALLNPSLNALAAFALYADNRHFMDTLWYIDRPGTARDRYLALLPRGLAAAARYTSTA